jgi:hypothetical protein
MVSEPYSKYKNEAFVDDSDSYSVTDSDEDIDPSVNDEETAISFLEILSSIKLPSLHSSHKFRDSPSILVR